MGQISAFSICKVLRFKWSEISGLTPGRDDIFGCCWKIAMFRNVRHIAIAALILLMPSTWNPIELWNICSKQTGLHCWVVSRIGVERQFAELTNMVATGSAVISKWNNWFLVKTSSGSLWFWFQFLRQWDQWETVCSGHFPPHWLEWCQKLRLWGLESRQMDLQCEEICNNLEFNPCWFIGHI